MSPKISDSDLNEHDFNFTDYCIKCRRHFSECIDKRGLVKANCYITFKRWKDNIRKEYHATSKM